MCEWKMTKENEKLMNLSKLWLCSFLFGHSEPSIKHGKFFKMKLLNTNLQVPRITHTHVHTPGMSGVMRDSLPLRKFNSNELNSNIIGWNNNLYLIKVKKKNNEKTQYVSCTHRKKSRRPTKTTTSTCSNSTAANNNTSKGNEHKITSRRSNNNRATAAAAITTAKRSYLNRWRAVIRDNYLGRITL